MPAIIRRAAINVLNDLAKQVAPARSLEEQVKIYQALGDTLPTHRERKAAKLFARALSAAAARQMEFAQIAQIPHDGHS